MNSTVLLADDDATVRTVLDQALGRAGYSVRATSNVATLWKWIAAGEGDLVVTDLVMPDGDAFELLPRVRRQRPGLPVIVMSAQNTFLTAIRASEEGAFDYLPKPFDLQDLLRIVARAVRAPRRSRPVETATLEPDGMPLVGRSPAMQDVYRVLARLMQTELTLMISGESGTGKELVARALHDYGRRRHGPFVAINMAAIPRELIEAELFGHEKGAFTGAGQRLAGRFEQAEGGTLFLDEIGDMPMEAQTRLLRVLQQGEFTSVGGRQPQRTNVRIVAATNRDLQQRIAQGQFREDLFYRLNVVPMRLPPLRERLEDIPDLANHFLVQAQRDGLPLKRLDRSAIAALQRHAWPGNVRELENLMRRLAALSVEDTITSEGIEQELVGSLPPQAPTGSPEAAVPVGLATERWLSDHFARARPDLPPPGLYHRLLHEMEAPLLAATLAATAGNQLRAAELLGVNRNTLRKKLREHGISLARGLSGRLDDESDR